MLADHRAVVVVAVVPDVVARVGDVEVVRPEVAHDLEELTLAPHGTSDRGHTQVAHQVPREVLDVVSCLRDVPLHAGKAVRDELVAVAVVQLAGVELAVEPGSCGPACECSHAAKGSGRKWCAAACGGSDRRWRSLAPVPAAATDAHDPTVPATTAPPATAAEP